MNLRFLGVV